MEGRDYAESRRLSLWLLVPGVRGQAPGPGSTQRWVDAAGSGGVGRADWGRVQNRILKKYVSSFS